MAIAEYTSKPYTFTTTPEQAEFLDGLNNKAKFIRQAISEKIANDDKKRLKKFNKQLEKSYGNG